MTPTPHTAEALALQLDDYARGDEYQRCTEDAAAMLRSQAQEIERLREALESIALAGMSGTGQESKEAMTEWHARKAWNFISIAARALSPDSAELKETE